MKEVSSIKCNLNSNKAEKNKTSNGAKREMISSRRVDSMENPKVTRRTTCNHSTMRETPR